MAKNITSKIELNVELDANRIPEKLFWTAQDGGITNEEATNVLPLLNVGKHSTSGIYS